MHFTTIPRLLAAAAWLALVRAQTFQSTVPVPDGNTVVISVSSDPIAGTVPVVIGTVSEVLPVTDSAAASTPLATQTPAATTPAATTAPGVTTTTPRVVGTPGATTDEAGPTTYRYTTTDANGQPVVMTDTYTPTYNVGTVSTAVAVGTIMPYDQYTSIYGGGSGSGSTPSGAIKQLATFGASASAVICILGGIVLLL
ncbi:hypothetical protein BDV93DRAFT_606217 [Ceratobasidium sp. AG-I]|nr:hypothetical protein BDV93DRAFT_606217 [Ceratobasidium sp. AG-I]